MHCTFSVAESGQVVWAQKVTVLCQSFSPFWWDSCDWRQDVWFEAFMQPGDGCASPWIQGLYRNPLDLACKLRRARLVRASMAHQGTSHVGTPSHTGPPCGPSIPSNPAVSPIGIGWRVHVGGAHPQILGPPRTPERRNLACGVALDPFHTGVGVGVASPRCNVGASPRCNRVSSRFHCSWLLLPWAVHMGLLQWAVGEVGWVLRTARLGRFRASFERRFLHGGLGVRMQQLAGKCMAGVPGVFWRCPAVVWGPSKYPALV